METNKETKVDLGLTQTELNYRIIKIGDTIKGLHAILNNFYENNIGSACGVEVEDAAALYGSIYPLILSTLENHINDLNKFANDLDMYGLALSKETRCA